MGLRKKRIATHPEEALLGEYIEHLGLTQASLANELGISTNRPNELVRGKRGITADTALRLARRFRTSPELWMNLQSAYELTEARVAMADRGEVQPASVQIPLLQHHVPPHHQPVRGHLLQRGQHPADVQHGEAHKKVAARPESNRAGAPPALLFSLYQEMCQGL